MEAVIHFELITAVSGPIGDFVVLHILIAFADHANSLFDQCFSVHRSKHPLEIVAGFFVVSVDNLVRLIVEVLAVCVFIAW